MRIKTLGIFLTKKCNFDCLYCCADTGRDGGDKLTSGELENVINQAASLGAKAVCIAGEGEPLLDENLFSVCEHIRSLHMMPRVVTNMALIDYATASRLRSLGVALVCKLNSLQPATVDLLVGKKNSYVWRQYSYRGRQWMIPQPLKFLLEAGYQQPYQNIPSRRMLVLQSVATRYNTQDLVELARFTRAVSVGLDIETLLLPKKEEYRTQLSLNREEEIKLYREVSAVLGVRYRLWSKCRCVFEENPFIDSQGNIRYCFGWEKSAGNIREKTLWGLHKEQLSIKKKSSGISPIINLRQHGFRQCRTRIAINKTLS